MTACARCLRWRILLGAATGIIVTALVAPGILARLAAGMPSPGAIAAAMMVAGLALFGLRLALWRAGLRAPDDG